ncbi:hypothetical protein [Mucilaginibacter sp. FT3.2]|uniref:hypothetical protein n=1 Tax=Mucilaginibacter sp. FT3.2 TaxID=2723090 RepID=UPI00160AE47C|nr:hypothetical protein [Mucilaginibacter sp. FT3.2]MBB6234933.1 hypothetical protein [Mucilaginibacter sp. FT3.2]
MGKQHQTFQSEPAEVAVTKKVPKIQQPADPTKIWWVRWYEWSITSRSHFNTWSMKFI